MFSDSGSLGGSIVAEGVFGARRNFLGAIRRDAKLHTQNSAERFIEKPGFESSPDNFTTRGGHQSSHRVLVEVDVINCTDPSANSAKKPPCRSFPRPLNGFSSSNSQSSGLVQITA